MIYLDTSATTPLLPEARDAMLKLMDESISCEQGNASSLHSAGSRAKYALNEARSEIAKYIGVPPLELIFTSSGSESNNTVIRTFECCPILVSAVEHPSVLHAAEAYGDPCIKIPVNKYGVIDLEFIKKKLGDLTKDNPRQKILVSVMLANNETGTIEPVKSVSALIKGYKDKGCQNIYLHSDATQAVSKMPVNAKDLGVDYLTFTAHKLGGPIGISALYARTGVPFKPLIIGGAQENKRRAGTSNVILAAGFAAAVTYCREKDVLKKYQNIRALRDYLAKEIESKILNTRIITPLDKDASLPNILNVTFPYTEGESTQLYLDLEGIEVSTGSACASGDLEPSHVLMAMYHDAEIAHGSVRFSLPLNITKRELDRLMAKLPGIVTKIQDLSTLNKAKS